MKNSLFGSIVAQHQALLAPRSRPFVPMGARAGSIGAYGDSHPTINLVAKIGSLPDDWWEHPAPPPPPWIGPVTDPWVQITVLPQVGGPHGHMGAVDPQGRPLRGYPDEHGVWHDFGPIGWGVIFDPQNPNAHGIPTYVGEVLQPITGHAEYVMAKIAVPENAWPGWPRAQASAQPSTSWLAATKTDAKPSNTTGQWVKITHDPGAGPSINGQATQQGRGIVFEQIGTGARRRLGTVIVYGVKPAQAGWLAEVSYYESSTPKPPEHMPKCPPSQGVYRTDDGRLVCGVPKQLHSTTECHGLDGFTLPSQGGGGGGGAPSGGGSGIECGSLVKEPTGSWAAATFFDQPPHRLHQGMWVQITASPGDHGWRFGEGILHLGNKVKLVLIVEIDGGQQRVRARFVPNDGPFYENKPEPTGGGAPSPGYSPPGMGFAPFGTPVQKRPIMRGLLRGRR